MLNLLHPQTVDGIYIFRVLSPYNVYIRVYAKVRNYANYPVYMEMDKVLAFPV